MSATTILNDFVRIGNKGTQIILTMTEVVAGVETAVDLSAGVSTVQIETRKPRGTITTLTASILNLPGTDGKIHHIDSTGIFDRRGRWQTRGIINYSNGNLFKGSWAGFQVGQ